VAQIGGQRRLKVQSLAAYRMRECKRRSVQRGAIEHAHCIRRAHLCARSARLHLRARSARIRIRSARICVARIRRTRMIPRAGSCAAGAAVGGVAQNGKAGAGQVDADLVGAAGFGAHFQLRNCACGPARGQCCERGTVAKAPNARRRFWPPPARRRCRDPADAQCRGATRRQCRRDRRSDAAARSPMCRAGGPARGAPPGRAVCQSQSEQCLRAECEAEYPRARRKWARDGGARRSANRPRQRALPRGRRCRCAKRGRPQSSAAPASAARRTMPPAPGPGAAPLRIPRRQNASAPHSTRADAQSKLGCAHGSALSGGRGAGADSAAASASCDP